MQTHIANREFKLDPNGWIEVLRCGEYDHSSSGIVQIVDRPALDSIVARFTADKQEPNFPGLLVDRDHFSNDVDKSSEAMGWVVELRREGESLLAHVEWSLPGEQAVRAGTYRLLSPVFRREDLEDMGAGRKRPLRLDSVGLTNVPNMRGLRPISNRAPSRDDLTPAEIEQLPPAEAATRFSVICNRVVKETGIGFDEAWNKVRVEQPALFNRMAARDQKPSGASSGVTEQEFQKYASDALFALTEQERGASGRSFAESYQKISNRNPQLVCLTNRGTAESEAKAKWAEWEQVATRQFCSGVSPDGDLLTRIKDRKHREKVEQQIYGSYTAAKAKYPGLTTAELLEKVRETNSANYWAWVAMTAAQK